MYYTLKAKNLKKEDEDVFVSFVFDIGASGLSEALDFQQLDATYQTQFLDHEIKSLEVYFLTKPSTQSLGELKKRFSYLDLQLEEAENKDWLKEWKKDYKPFCLVSNIWVVPSWLEAPKEAESILYIDPEMAFGTGTHETTKLCAEEIFELLKRKPLNTALDVGCGTGILAMLCELLGVSKIEASEIDADARACAKKNIDKNKKEKVFILDEQIESLKKQYDLVIANIIDGVLLNIKEDLISRTKVGGYMILSGILLERQKNFESIFIDDRLKLITTKSHNEWLAYILERKK